MEKELSLIYGIENHFLLENKESNDLSCKIKINAGYKFLENIIKLHQVM